MKWRYLFKAGWHTPATGLHEAIVPAHVLTDLPVLFTALLPTDRKRRVAKERCNTITGQSMEQKDRERERQKGRTVRKRASVSQPAYAKVIERERGRVRERTENRGRGLEVRLKKKNCAALPRDTHIHEEAQLRACMHCNDTCVLI